MLAADFAGRILPFDSAAASAYARIAADRRRSGRPIARFDAQIAAIASSRSAALATRNMADFVDCGVSLLSLARSAEMRNERFAIEGRVIAHPFGGSPLTKASAASINRARSPSSP